MTTTLTIVRYPKRFAYFGLCSMVIFHSFLWMNKSIFFYKLLGCGKNGSFDAQPDLRYWALLVVHKNDQAVSASNECLFGKKIAGWWKRFRCETITVALEAIEGHGKWDGKECFGQLPKQSPFAGSLAVLTRASIRTKKVRSFWKNVSAAAEDIKQAPGYITSYGIGELPWIRQATFSVWESKEAMKNYAYKNLPHQQVIQKTRKENWFSEEMFVRFKILWSNGMLNGQNEIMEYLKKESALPF